MCIILAMHTMLLLLNFPQRAASKNSPTWAMCTIER